MSCYSRHKPLEQLCKDVPVATASKISTATKPLLSVHGGPKSSDWSKDFHWMNTAALLEFSSETI